MKVIEVINDIDLDHGGPSRSLPNMAIGLKKLGVDTSVLSYYTDKANDEGLHKNGVELLYVPKESGRWAQIMSSNFHLPETEGKVVVHSQHTWEMSLHNVQKDCQKRGIPYIISPRGSMEPWAMKQKALKKKLAMWLYQRKDMELASCIHTTAISEMEHVRALGFRNPIAVVPNGIIIENYPEREYKIHEKKTALFLSRIHPKKGLPMLFEAWSKIDDRIKKDWQINIVGEGSNEYGIDDLNDLIRDQYAEMPINVIGPKYGKEKLDCYQQADLFILPSHSENFGMVIAEALCTGVPVITTTGCPWECLHERKAGWWVDPTPEDIKRALECAMQMEDEELFAMGKNGRQLIIDDFSLESVAQKFKQLYGWLLGEEQKPGFVYEVKEKD